MEYKISIIVPVYGVESYIERCAISLFRQTLDSIEYIFVDDCSLDKSIHILEKIMERFPNRSQHTTIIRHSSNRGLPSARRTGLEKATGKYILHIDSDDWMELDMCEKMYVKAESGNCDIVICDYKRVSQNEQTVVSNCYSDHFYEAFLNCEVTGAVWNKLIRRSIFVENNFIYPTCSFGEDFVIIAQACYYSKNIGYVPEALYAYVYNPNSITGSIDIPKIKKTLDDNYTNYKIVESFMKDHEIVDEFRNEIIFHKLKMKNYIRKQIKYDRCFLKIWRNTFPEMNRQVWSCKYIGPRLILSYYSTLLGIWTGR